MLSSINRQFWSELVFVTSRKNMLIFISDVTKLLPSEQVKTLLLTWLTSSSEDLEDFEQLLTNQPTQTTAQY